MERQVTVIVPAYNAEQTLERCVESILQQSRPANEIIIVNDGSTDKTLSIARAIAEANPSVKVIDQPNGGVSAARNAGLGLASGEFIQFVDSDDFLEPIATDTLVSFMDDEVDLVIAAYMLGGSDGTQLPREYLLPIPFEGVCDTIEYINSHLSYLLGDGHAVNKLYRREILATHDITFSTNVTVLEDLLFNLQYLQFSRRIRFTNTEIYNVTNSPDSAIFSYHPSWLDAATLVTARLRNLQQLDSLDLPVKAEIAKRLFHYYARALRNELHPDNPSGTVERLKNISRIMNMPEVQRAVRAYVPTTLNNRLIALLTRLRLSLTFFLVSRLYDRRKPASRR